MPKQPKPHVQQHLKDRGVDIKRVPDGVIDALNDCTPQELKAMDRVGESLEAANVDTQLRVSMVH